MQGGNFAEEPKQTTKETLARHTAPTCLNLRQRICSALLTVLTGSENNCVSICAMRSESLAHASVRLCFRILSRTTSRATRLQIFVRACGLPTGRSKGSLSLSVVAASSLSRSRNVSEHSLLWSSPSRRSLSSCSPSSQGSCSTPPSTFCSAASSGSGTICGTAVGGSLVGSTPNNLQWLLTVFGAHAGVYTGWYVTHLLHGQTRIFFMSKHV